RAREVRPENARAERDPNLRQQPAADDGPDEADDDGADDPKTGSAHDVAGQPAGDRANEQNNKKALTRPGSSLRGGPQICGKPFLVFFYKEPAIYLRRLDGLSTFI